MPRFIVKPSTTGVSEMIKKLDQNPRMVATFLDDLLKEESSPESESFIIKEILNTLQQFCQQPTANVLPPIVDHLLEIKDTQPESAFIYGLLACIFYSYRRPLLAMEYANYAQSLETNMPPLVSKVLQRLPHNPVASTIKPLQKPTGLMPAL